MSTPNDFMGNYLRKVGSKLYVGKKRLFDGYKKNSERYQSETKFPKGKEFIKSDIQVKISHTELQEYQYHIIQKKSNKKYAIAPTANSRTVKDIANIKIMLSTKDQVVYLKGPNTESNKVSLFGRGAKKKPIRVDYKMDGNGRFLEPDYDEIRLEVEKTEDSWQGNYDKVEEIIRTNYDVAFMITVNNEIVCFEKDPINPYKTLFIGDTGSYKTQSLMRVLSQAFHRWEDDMWFTVDPLSQFAGSWEGMQYYKFVEGFRAVGERALGLPMVYFYMASKDVPKKIDKTYQFYYPLDNFEFFNKYEFFTHGLESWKLGGAARYLKKVSSKLSNCTKQEQVEKILNDAFPAGKQDTLKGMKEKWLPTFSTIFSFKFLNSFYNVELKWKSTNRLFEFKGDPILASMHAGMFTVLNIDHAKNIPESNKACSRNIIANIFQKILKYRRKYSDIDTRRINICFDELNDVYKGMRGGGDNLTKVTNEVFTQGRIQKISFWGTKQGFQDLPPDLLQNATTMIFGQIGSSAVDRLKISKAFNLTMEQARQFEDLKPEKREIICVQKSPFVVYGRDGKRYYGKKFYRGFLIPPICNTVK